MLQARLRQCRSFLIASVVLAILFVSGMPTQAAGTVNSNGIVTRECPASHLPTKTVPLGEVQATLQSVYDTYSGLPGFVDVYYYPGQKYEFRPMFLKSVPAEAYDRTPQVAVAFDVLPDEPQPAGPGTTPDTNDILCGGIRPGRSISNGCTLNFVFTDGVDTYIGTAGHCVANGASVSSPGIGVFGTVVYSSGDAGVGNDFALIRINANKLFLVTAEMCDWAGPMAVHTAGSILGKVTLQTGHGSGIAAPNVPPRPRPGVGFGFGVNSFSWEGTSIPGDSGSGIRLQEGGKALGVVTHLGVGIGAINFGTHIPRSLSLAAAGGFPGLSVVTVPYTHIL